jgi:hypothetical protein
MRIFGFALAAAGAGSAGAACAVIVLIMQSAAIAPIEGIRRGQQATTSLPSFIMAFSSTLLVRLGPIGPSRQSSSAMEVMEGRNAPPHIRWWSTGTMRNILAATKVGTMMQVNCAKN